jgi:hypothetical protein
MARTERTEVSVSGVVEDILVFRGNADRMGVLTIYDAERKKQRIVGVTEGIRTGDSVEVTGLEQMHPHYGMQIRAQKIDTILPRTQHAAADWLTRHFGVPWKVARTVMEVWYRDFGVLGQTKSMAAAVIAGPGDFQLVRLWNMIIDDDAGVREHFKTHNADDAYAMLNKYVVRKHVTDTLVKMGLDTKEAFALYMLRGKRAAEELKEDPYIVYYYLENVPFKKIDDIYLAQPGNKKRDDRRVRATCLYELRSCTDEGHTAMYYEDFLDLIEELHPEFSATKLVGNIQELIPEFILLYGNPPMVQLAPYARFESGIAEFVMHGKVLTVPPDWHEDEEYDG